MTRPRARRSAFVALGASVAAVVLAAGACSDGAGTTGAGDEPGGTLTVLGAASLTDALGRIAAGFEDAHPGIDVELSFGGSSALAAAVIEGAPADVLAAADEATIERLDAAGLVARGPVTVATSRLQIVVPAGNPAGIDDLGDLTGGDVRIALCRAEVPCGRYARMAFDEAGLTVPAAGAEADVRSVLAKVRLGEADAGLVYATDVAGAAGVEGLELGHGVAVRATYPAAVLEDAPNPDAADLFLAYLRGDDARAELVALGFGVP